jgi:nucleotide-binding universal stress UspA family protein
MGIIVVGVDGSDSSRAALAWALAEAKLRGSTLRAVHAWMIPALGTGEAPWAMMPPDSYVEVSADEIEKATHDALDRELAEAGPDPGLAVERFVQEGPAADVIVDASKDAELVVVGTRGRGAIKTLLLGSTSQHVIQHATCPVVVVSAHDA